MIFECLRCRYVAEPQDGVQAQNDDARTFVRCRGCFARFEVKILEGNTFQVIRVFPEDTGSMPNDPNTIFVDKATAAVRQLELAIGLHFKKADPLGVRTLAGAAAEVFKDLALKSEARSSWANYLFESNNHLPRDVVKNAMYGAENFLKHADKDPNDVLHFDVRDNDHIIFLASLDAPACGTRLTLRMQVMQLWYLSVYPVDGMSNALIQSMALDSFPGLSAKDRQAQLELGLYHLKSFPHLAFVKQLNSE